MPPRGVKKGTKRARQYEHIKESLEDQGRSEGQRRRSRPGPSTRSARVTARRASRPTCPARTSPPGAGVGFGRIGRGRAADRDQLYEEAKAKGVKGRSKMSKAELARAVGSRS